MRITIHDEGCNDADYILNTQIDTGGKEVTIRDCYIGVGIQTEQGLFGIAQRDGGIEVMLTPPGGETRTIYHTKLCSK